MKKPVMIALIVVFLLVFLFSAWQLIGILTEYRKGEQTYERLEHYVSMPETNPKEEKPQKEDAPEEAAPEEAPVEVENPFPEVDFDALKAINEDVVGWIYIPDTRVNYPVLQGENNDQYLYHLLTGDYNGSGSIFLDAKVPGDFSGNNSPIYGHNMKNDTMFADMVEYKKQEFYDEHPVAMLMTPEKNYLVHLFSGYVTDSWGSAWDKEFDEGEFEKWLQEVAGKTCFETEVTPSKEDRVLTFSTCTYETGDGRFVVHGILEEYTLQ